MRRRRENVDKSLGHSLLHPLRPRFSHLRLRVVFLAVVFTLCSFFLCRLLNTGGLAWEFSPTQPSRLLYYLGSFDNAQ